METEFQRLQRAVADLSAEVRRLSDLVSKDNFDGNQLIVRRQIHQDGVFYVFGRTYGTKIGSTTSEKIGFFGATPVVQQGAVTTPSGGLTVDTQARVAIGEIKTALANLGLTA